MQGAIDFCGIRNSAPRVQQSTKIQLSIHTENYMIATLNPTPLTGNAAAGISPIESILQDFAAGKMVILVDDESRENEGDLLLAAHRVTAEHINFMATHGRGLICLSMTKERCRDLQLPLMVKENTSPYATAFTISIEAAKNVSTGISAADRATTIQAAVREHAKPADLVTPGHIFPVVAEPGGVLIRAGHTEAGSDLAKLCGFEPASVLCEILNPDGTMARLNDLVEFSKLHDIKIGTIADLIRYRMATESTVAREHETNLMTDYGEVRAITYRDKVSGYSHLALVRGQIVSDSPTILRVHVFTGLTEVLDAITPGGHSYSIRRAMQRIAREASGAVLILNYQRDFGDLPVSGSDDEVQLDDGAGSHDVRIVGIGSQIAADLGFGQLRVLGHPRKMHGLSGFGLTVVEYLPPED